MLILESAQPVSLHLSDVSGGFGHVFGESLIVKGQVVLEIAEIEGVIRDGSRGGARHIVKGLKGLGNADACSE